MRRCEICKQPIEADRSEAIRDTGLCVEHARQIARYGGEFVLTAVQERTSRPGSLKRNYGGIDTAKLRNQEALDKLRADYEQTRHPA